MTARRRTLRFAVAAFVVLIAGSVIFIVRDRVFRPNEVTAYFTVATAIYPGDDVRVSGMKVGTVTAIKPQGTVAALTIAVDRDVRVPTNAKAVIVAQNLLASRYVQLTPAFQKGDSVMADGAVIPLERTAVPVEWDEVKQQLMRLATDLGPATDGASTPVSRFINSAADAMNGNGDKLRQTLIQLSSVARTLADGGGDIVGVLKNLQTFISALRDSGEQMVQFQGRLATLSSVLNDSRSDLDVALTTLTTAIADVQRFIAGTRDETTEQVQRLANVTQVLVDHKTDLENVLHVAPNAFSNGYGIYNPDTGGSVGTFVFNNFSNPMQFICGAIGAIENATSSETAKLCNQYLGPALRVLNFNHIGIPVNPVLSKSASPSNIVYSEPGLAPDGAGPVPTVPDIPPAVSAYTGLPTDVGSPPSVVMPLPPAMQPANVADMLAPGGSIAPAQGTELQQMLLPAEQAPPFPTGQGTPP